MKGAVKLWLGRTRHQRRVPFVRSFSYDVAMISVDVDRLDEADRKARWFSVDRANLVSFQSRNHTRHWNGPSLRAWAEQQLREAGVSAPIASLHLLTFPNVLGSGFAPISVWLARGMDDAVTGVIYEVHNTFGEAHAYVFAGRDDLPTHEAEKVFHVSPFFDVSGAYRFRLAVNDEIFALVVDNIEDGECVHSARLSLRARELTDRAIAGWLMRMPFSGFGVILAIHWQALKLWLKSARYHKKPVQRDRRTTQATAIEHVSLEHSAAVPNEDRRSA